jgi:hypothetical protein
VLPSAATVASVEAQAASALSPITSALPMQATNPASYLPSQDALAPITSAIQALRPSFLPANTATGLAGLWPGLTLPTLPAAATGSSGAAVAAAVTPIAVPAAAPAVANAPALEPESEEEEADEEAAAPAPAPMAAAAPLQAEEAAGAPAHSAAASKKVQTTFTRRNFPLCRSITVSLSPCHTLAA